MKRVVTDKREQKVFKLVKSGKMSYFQFKMWLRVRDIRNNFFANQLIVNPDFTNNTDGWKIG